MAKVMVSMPDELLAEVDAQARRTGSTRSAVLRGFAEDAIQRRRAKRAEAIQEILREASGHYGGNSAEQVKAGRPEP
jgi:metal-responsive CopG/Arc/MetJ family transcriptional regulator